MKRYKFFVLSNPKPGQEERFNTWYDTQHLPDVVKVPGFVRAQRFRIATPPTAETKWRYVAIYELETDDLAATMAQLRSRADTPSLMVSDALDREGVYSEIFEALTDPVDAPI